MKEIKRHASTIDTIQSTCGQTKTSSDSASLRAAVQKVIKAEMNKSKMTNYRYLKGMLKNSPWEKISLSTKIHFDRLKIQSNTFKTKNKMKKNALMSAISTDL